MSKIKTNLKDVLEVSPYLWEYQKNKKEVKEYVIQLINEGLDVSDVIHQTGVWLANNRKPVNPSVQKADYSVRANTAGTIFLNGTLKLPPYRRGKKPDQPSHIPPTPTLKTSNIPSQLRDWLASLDKSERILFTNWCVRQGKVASKSLWEKFKSTADISPSSDMSFKQRSFVADGWAKSKVRKSQGQFRQDVLANWSGRCAITGSAFAVEACHIISHSSGGVPSVENGIALAADLHHLLDSNHLQIIDNIAIFSDDAKNDPRYAAYHNIMLRTPIIPIKFS